MGIEFVLGTASAKTDEYILDVICRQITKAPLSNMIVLVPPQATYNTEMLVLDALNKKGIMGVSVMSVTRLADKVLSEVYGKNAPYMDNSAKSMLLRRVMKQHQDELASLSAIAQKEGIGGEIAKLISELKSMDITPEKLRAIETESEKSSRKFADIALLYEYFAEAASGFLDSEDRLNLVIETIPSAQFIRDAHVIVYGFDIYSAQYARLTRAIMHTAKQTTIRFLYEEEGAPGAHVYDICHENYLKFVKDAKELGLKRTVVEDKKNRPADLAHLAGNVYAHPAKAGGEAKNMSITIAENKEQELRAVCAQIVYLVSECGFKYSDIGVVCGDIAAYMPQIKDIFTRLNVPFGGGGKRALSTFPVSAFCLLALKLSGGRISKNDVIDYMKLGFLGLDERQETLLQNYAYKNISSGFVFLNPFAEDGEVEEARKKLAQSIVFLRDAAKNAQTVDGYIDMLFSLFEQLDLNAQIEMKTEQLTQAGLLESAAFFSASYPKMLELLNQARNVFRGAKMKSAQLLELLYEAFEDKEIATIPPRADEVALGDISNVRLPEIKALFVIGANEGVLPNYAETPDILTPKERETMLMQAAGVLNMGNIKMQQLAILKTFAKPSEKLFFSYIDDGKNAPSQLLSRVEMMFPAIRKNSAGAVCGLVYENALLQAGEYLRAKREGGDIDKAGEEIVASVFADGEQEKRAIMERALAEKNCAAKLTAANAAALYREISGTATRVEEYYRCPYKHFMRYGAKPDIMQEHTIGSLDVGLYAHDVLDGITKEVVSRNQSFAEINEAELTVITEACAQKTKEKQGKYTLDRKNAFAISEIDREISLCVQHIKAQGDKGAMRPCFSEYAFREDVGGMEIAGVIDRLDIARTNEGTFFDIVDYKTGTPKFSVKNLYYGLSLQLMIYIMAAEKIMQDAKFAGALYFRVALPEFSDAPNISKGYKMNGLLAVPAEVAKQLYGQDDAGLYALQVRITKKGVYHGGDSEKLFDTPDIRSLMEHTQKLISRAVFSIRDGRTDIAPAETKKSDDAPCKSCDYKSVCLFDERYAGNVARLLEPLKKDAVLEKIREERRNS